MTGMEFSQLIFIGRDEAYNTIVRIYGKMIASKTVDMFAEVSELKDSLEVEINTSEGNFDAGAYISVFKYRLSELYSRYGVSVDSDAPLAIFESIVDTVLAMESRDLDELEFMSALETSDLLTTEYLIRVTEELFPDKYSLIEIAENVDPSTYYIKLLKQAIASRPSQRKINLDILNRATMLIPIIPTLATSELFEDILAGVHTTMLDISNVVDRDVIIMEMSSFANLEVAYALAYIYGKNEVYHGELLMQDAFKDDLLPLLEMTEIEYNKALMKLDALTKDIKV